MTSSSGSETDDEIQNLSRRSNELRLKIRQKHIAKAMRCCQGAVDSLYTHMVAGGWTTEAIKDAKKSFEQNPGRAPSRQVTAARERKKTVEAQRKKRAADSLKLQAEEDLAEFQGLPWDEVPDKVHVMSDFTVGQLRDKIVPAIESSHASAANIRATKDKELNSKTGLLQLVELATGCQNDWPIAGKLRCYNRLGCVLQKRNVARGRRLLSVRFPPDFAGRGGTLELVVDNAGGLVVIKAPSK